MMFRPFLLVASGLLLLGPSLHADEVTRQVQEELRKRNLYFGDIDGRATPGFFAAVSSYQQRKGFAADGTLSDETLSSFGLRPPSPKVWPDVPVLKSDVALRAAVTPPARLPTPPTPPQPPEISDDAARLFVEKYLLAGQTNDPGSEAAFYAEHADYFDQGKVDRRFIERDIRRYDDRWPERYFSLDGPVRVTRTEDPSLVTVDIDYRFTVKGRKYSVQGRVGTTYTLVGKQSGDWRILRVKEQRMRR